MRKEVVQDITETFLKAEENLFLIDISISEKNDIAITIDGDNGVAVDDCIQLSRDIEGKLDREEEDFSLRVTSAGIDAPLIFPRQFKKNIGRKLKVKTAVENFKADLEKVTDEAITIRWKKREQKPVCKGKHTVNKEAVLTYKEIEEAKVLITF